jgi:hypothetical protein
LVRLGVPITAIDDRLRARRLRTIHRGVYVIGPKLMPHARDMAAVLACAPGAVLSHRTAGKLWELLPWVPIPSTHHVSVPGRNPGRRAGLTIHRVTAFLPDEVTTKHGIPVTSPARTLLDLSVELDDGDLEQAIGEAFARGRASRTALLAVLDRRRGTGAPHGFEPDSPATPPALAREQSGDCWLFFAPRVFRSPR